MKRSILLTLSFLFISIPLLAQGKLKVDINKDDNTYIKVSARTTTWIRFADLNPGTLINDEQKDSFTDFSIRRVRFVIASQLTPKLYTYMMIGNNNLNHRTAKTFQFKFLDAYAEYEFEKWFTLGLGKSAWVGLSRMDIRSSKSLMALDAPLFSLNTVNRTDDIGRMMGIFAKGQVDKFDYRFSIMQPLAHQQLEVTEDADFAYQAPNMKYSGYLKYQFFDVESNKSAYSSSTYLEKKKVLAIGAGLMFKDDATWNYEINNANDTTTVFNDLMHWAVDVFANIPLNKEKRTSITAYLGYYNFDYGPNYIRNVSANQMATGTNNSASFNGAGTGFPMMGTGNTIFGQLGYAFGTGIGILQPNLAIQYSNYEKLNDPMMVLDLGMNWYLDGHNHKITLGYQNRPIYDATTIKETERKGMFVIQYQIVVS